MLPKKKKKKGNCEFEILKSKVSKNKKFYLIKK